MRHKLADLPQLFEDEILDSVGAVTEVRADTDAARLELVLRLRGFDGFDEQRVIECEQAIRWNLTNETVYWFRVHDDHPALLPFVDGRADLYFSTAPADPDRVADAMRAASAELIGSYVEHDALVNGERGTVAQLLREGYGKVASGPLTLMRAFRDLLEAEGAKTSLLATGEPKMYIERDLRWVPVPRPLSLLDLGPSWVVARRFLCRAA